MKGIVLVGMMASGKTTVGQRLATALEVPFRDTDRLLAQRLGHSIPRLFELFGEATFRDHETALLRSLEPEPGVLATGGGIVLRDDNWPELRRLGTVIFLDASEEVLLTRLATARKKRPLLDFPDWEDRARAILRDRRPRYLLADHVVPIPSDHTEPTVQAILNIVQP